MGRGHRPARAWPGQTLNTSASTTFVIPLTGAGDGRNQCDLTCGINGTVDLSVTCYVNLPSEALGAVSIVHAQSYGQVSGSVIAMPRRYARWIPVKRLLVLSWLLH